MIRIGFNLASPTIATSPRLGSRGEDFSLVIPAADIQGHKGLVERVRLGMPDEIGDLHAVAGEVEHDVVARLCSNHEFGQRASDIGVERATTSAYGGVGAINRGFLANASGSRSARTR